MDARWFLAVFVSSAALLLAACGSSGEPACDGSQPPQQCVYSNSQGGAAVCHQSCGATDAAACPSGQTCSFAAACCGGGGCSSPPVPVCCRPRRPAGCWTT